LNNVVEHPCRGRRIAQAKAAILESLRRLGRDNLSLFRRSAFEELITSAMVHELEMPGSGFAVLERGLRLTGRASAPGREKGNWDYKNRKMGVSI
jgi:hypothetical protein